ncbi:MmgE/PrpD family protein [Bordetella petrii]|uniref:MmgE/PrpD family protein n=1 Tax=Bordetella petrii TaxID=94624 RepID=UPI001E3265C3|nr:MmgE/PrpD family protein [Bordetella petrii]MCD0504721.1 MmgE/PrpD family protein [Bordetella petrii]
MKDHVDTPAAGLALSETLAQYAAGFDAARIPAPVRERARLLMLDSIGIALASHGYDFSRRALAAVRELDSGGDSVVIGTELRMDARNAALANGVLVHGLDYDDTHARGVIHATASVLPTVLAVAARDNRSGADMVAAYVLGMEVATRLGAVAKGGFHQVGFHPTGLIGTFGCTLAAGWLQGLDARQMADAQGIALSVAAGSLEFLNDGAWNKRMHPGWAAQAGMTAATFGKHGYTGTRLAYEGRFGLYASHLGEASYDLGLATAGLGELWEVERVSVKPLPACHFTHASVDAAARLHAQGVRPEQIRRVTVLVPAEVVKTVCEPEAAKRKPANSYEAQFSIPYLVGTALCKGRLTLDDLEDEALRDPAVLALAAITDYRHDPDSGFPRHYSGEVIVELKDGRTLREREAVNRGAEDRPLTAEDILAKYRDNALRQVPQARAQAIERGVLDLEQGTARDLADQLGQA